MPPAAHCPLVPEHAALAGHPLTDALARRLGPLTETAAELAARAHASPLARGQTLLRADETWQSAWWVERGALRLYYLDRNGLSSNKNFFLDDALLWPITPTLRNSPAGFFVDALEDSVIWAVPYDALARALETLPAWADLRHRILCALLDDKMQRERAFLQTSARQRYQALLHEHPTWAARIALKHLASYLGVTDVSLSCLRAEMGLIKG